eukprot:s786_g1.t1
MLYVADPNPEEQFGTTASMSGTGQDTLPDGSTLASWLASRIKAGEAAALDTFRRVMELWEPNLAANTRNQKALWILNKFHRALGDEAWPLLRNLLSS